MRKAANNKSKVYRHSTRKERDIETVRFTVLGIGQLSYSRLQIHPRSPFPKSINRYQQDVAYLIVKLRRTHQREFPRTLDVGGCMVGV